MKCLGGRDPNGASYGLVGLRIGLALTKGSGRFGPDRPEHKADTHVTPRSRERVPLSGAFIDLVALQVGLQTPIVLGSTTSTQHNTTDTYRISISTSSSWPPRTPNSLNRAMKMAQRVAQEPRRLCRLSRFATVTHAYYEGDVSCSNVYREWPA